MKLATYQRDDTVSIGLVTPEGLVDIPAAWPEPDPPRSVKQILERGPACRRIGRGALSDQPVQHVLRRHAVGLQSRRGG